MESFGPWEDRATIACAVSGGPDSMALTLMAAAWAERRKGRAVGLTVDHGLRDGSAAEAAQTGRWLAPHGIAHHVLNWTGDKPNTRIQERAREARYGLLQSWCAAHGVLHLLTAHHAEDQVETVRFRASRGSGSIGLAGMPAVSWRSGVRVVRPLLELRQQDLQSWLGGQGQPALDDPSNRDRRFERARQRSAPLSAAAWQQTYDRTLTHARARRAADRATATGLAKFVRLDPSGFVRVRAELLAGAPARADAVLARCLTTVGGRTYEPDTTSLSDLAAHLLARRDDSEYTLGGCLLFRRGADLIICREPARVAPPVHLTAGVAAVWDRRFTATLPEGVDAPTDVTVGALGRGDWQELRKTDSGQQRAADRVPARAGESIPAVRVNGDVIAVAGVCQTMAGADGPPVCVEFTPPRCLATADFRPSPPINDRAATIV